MPLTPRPEVFDAYWRLAAERQEIFFSRLEGSSAPWTDDPILRTHKFCNSYRASDRVSQYLINEVIYNGIEYRPEDHILRIVLFRLFSKPSTWELLVKAFGDVTVATFEPARFAKVLDKAFAARETLYTSAFILCANRSFGFDRKHRNHLALVESMLAVRRLPRQVAEAKSLSALYSALATYPLIGPFMAYQIATDLNYSEVCDFSENEFSVAGPGARRGIAKCFEDTAGWSDEQVIMAMVDRQEDEFERLGIRFRSLFGRPLHAIDAQNLFCETDKYARVAFPALVSNRTRIKTKFRLTGPLPAPAYPPKWGLAVPTISLGSERQLQTA